LAVRIRLGGIVTFLLLLPFAPSAWSQTAGSSPERLTLDAAIAGAMRNNREIRNATLEVDKSENRIAAGRTERYPYFKVGIEQSYLLAPLDLTFERGSLGTIPGTGPIPDRETTVRTPTGWTTALSAGIVQPLAGLYRIGLGIERLEVGREIARELLRGQRLTVVNDVKRSYYGALQTEASLEAIEESIGFHRELLRVVEENVRQQAALPADALDVKARLTRAEYNALTLRNSLASRKEELNQLIGRDVNTDFQLVPVGDASLLETDLVAARARALRQRPEMTGGQLRIKEAEYALRMKKAEYIPDFNLVLKYFSPITSDVLPKHVAYTGFELSWDVFDWGRKKEQMAEQKKTIEQATNRLADLEPQIIREVNGGHRKLQEARALLDVARLSLEAEREKLRVALNRYSQQLVLLKDTLQSQTAVADANQQYQNALLSFWMARADFERAVGEE
jgi:outer membrane protein TolC